MVNMKALLTGTVLGIIGIIVVLQLFAGTAGDLVGAGNNVSATGLPGASLFSGTGVLMLIIVFMVLIAVISLALKLGGGK